MHTIGKTLTLEFGEMKIMRRTLDTKKKIQTIISIFILSTTFIGLANNCGQRKIPPKNLLAIENIERANMEKNSNSNTIVTKQLTREQIKIFADKWNNSSRTSIWKLLGKYRIIVYAKNSETRNFQITGKSITDHPEGYLYDLEDEKYIEKLWEEAETNPIQ